MIFELPSKSIDIYANYALVCFINYFLSAYIFCKSQYIKLSISKLLYLLITNVLFTVLFVIVKVNSITLSHLLYYLSVPLLFGVILQQRKQIFKSIVIGSISISIVSVLEVASVLIQSLVSWIIKFYPHYVVAYILCEIITTILCISIMKIKRFKRGIQFFRDEKNLGLGLALSEIVMILKCMNLRENQESNHMFIVFIIGIIIAGFGLYLWISRSITAHYRERQQLRSEEHYKEILEERDREIEKLNQSNAYLAKVVHRDNHLMSNLNTSIDMYFNSDDEAYKENLLRELQTLSKERLWEFRYEYKGKLWWPHMFFL